MVVMTGYKILRIQNQVMHPESLHPYRINFILTVRAFYFAVNQFSPSPNRFVPQSPGQKSKNRKRYAIQWNFTSKLH